MSAVPDIGVSAWLAMLRKISEVKPGTATAIAVLSLVNQQWGATAKLRHGMGVDAYMKRGLAPALKDHDALGQRIATYTKYIERAQELFKLGHIEEPGTVAFEYVTRPLLWGTWPKDFQFGSELAKRGLKTRALDGAYQGMPDAQLSATLWNQFAAASRLEQTQVIAGDPGIVDALASVRGWLTFTAADLEHAAPGEESTTIDAVTGAINDALAAANKVLQAAGSGAWTIVKYAAIGAGGVAAVWIASRVFAK